MELKGLGWPDEAIALYEELWEYRRRWGSIAIEPDERTFLMKADKALAQNEAERIVLEGQEVNSVERAVNDPRACIRPLHGISMSPMLGDAGVSKQCFVALDFETADHGRDSACSIALVRVEEGSIVHREYHLIRPPRKTFVFTRIHGIGWSQVANALPFGELWPQLEQCLDGAQFIAAHNATFDKSVLQACCHKANIMAPPHPYLCTVQLARKTWDIRPTKLPNVCERLNLSLKHHDALSDAEACANIVLAAIRDGGLSPMRTGESF
ncbi:MULTISPECIES: 3'-5' exonuclease [Aphanothece]|uniref:3'-5' exonuclease n=1 Tax=Aphanothece TaxID=1121 RepID=UPI00398498FC